MPRDTDKNTGFEQAAARLLTAGKSGDTNGAADPRPPEYSDDALALLFADQLALDLRYVAAWAKWLRWSVDVWREDTTLAIFDDARAIARQAAATCKKQKTGVVIKSAKTIAAIERLARSDRRVAAVDDQWDSDLLHLNERPR
jgi:putative DNA primase/helicase